ncbi:MAG: 3-isopropylmalate dehydratase [Pseudomonadota bacterium]|nr:3-isopropylmalate dehydratase [Pseudomonadota bacterium]
MMIIKGKTWVFGDEMNTDNMAPGIYFKEPIAVLASHCLEAVNPDFAKKVEPGDIVVGGRNFGVGSAREQAAMSFRELGVSAILAESFSRIFYRNAINFGLPLLIFPQANEILPGELLEVDPVQGIIINRSSDKSYQVAGIPKHLMHMINSGGLMPWLKKKYASNHKG